MRGLVVLPLARRSLNVARRIQAALPDALLEEPGRPASFREALTSAFAGGRPIVAVAASGIVIRILAPILHDKRTEPPVVVVAEDGGAVVPLLGGHHGANRIATRIAAYLGIAPAITTASDVHLGGALDDPPRGWRLAPGSAVGPVSKALLEGRPVAVAGEPHPDAWLRLPRSTEGASARLRVTVQASEPGAEEVVLHPAVLALGIGCERGVSADEVLDLVERTLADAGLAPASLACFASLDLKEDEAALEALEERYRLPLRLFDAAALEAETPRLASPSEVVFRSVGCHGVAEAAALAAAGPGARLIVPKRKSARATCAVAQAPEPIEPDRVGRGRGRLALVGLGPGDPSWRTGEATRLLREASDLVGYRGYLELVEERPGQTRHAYELGEEEVRCRRALELAVSGRRVALVCSGDPGIFAMAALVVGLIEGGENPAFARLELVVSPGVSALQAAAARAGAPLGHDFCAISLSDLLTPWDVIERRLEAAASADFVTVLFNPASRRRRTGLARALEILVGRRSGHTPVVLARNLGRVGEALSLHTLGSFDPDRVDMLSLVIVGSSATRIVRRPARPPLVVTPRGYPTGGGE